MKCIECKWFAGQHNDAYGVCKRFPQIENKSQQDWCGEYSNKVVVVTPAQEEPVQPITISFVEETEYDINTDQIKPKRGRKPKA